MLAMARPLTVLLVDDNPADRELLREAFAELGADVDLVAYGDATAFVQRIPAQAELPDLVILDLGMPRLDGYAVLAQVQAAWPSVPVVVMSASSVRDREHRALTAGARAFFPKPARFEDHLAVVREALAFARDPAARA